MKQKGITHLCGDQVQVYLKLNEKKNVEELTLKDLVVLFLWHQLQ